MTSTSEATRVVIAGAASLRGSELKQWLEESGFPAAEIRLLDEEIVAGTLTEAGGEPAIIETADESSFERARFVFFTGSPKFSVRHGAEAQRAGATVIDLSGGLLPEPGSRLWIPALDSVFRPPMDKLPAGKPASLFLAPSAPAHTAISLSAALEPLGVERLAITIFQPVSEYGRDAIEELESQVINLLSFQPISTSVFDTQVGFNMLARYGSESRANLAEAQAAIVAEVRSYLAGRLPMPAISLVHAPVFYSHTFAVYAELKPVPKLEDIVMSLRSAGLKVTDEDEEPPTNISVVGEAQPIFRHPQRDPGIENGVWLWGAADNLRVPVATAVTIAEKLLAS
jgi:aspartate-semialdehyde dehydrogenase